MGKLFRRSQRFKLKSIGGNSFTVEGALLGKGGVIVPGEQGKHPGNDGPVKAEG